MVVQRGMSGPRTAVLGLPCGRGRYRASGGKAGRTRISSMTLAVFLGQAQVRPRGDFHLLDQGQQRLLGIANG